MERRPFIIPPTTRKRAARTITPPKPPEPTRRTNARPLRARLNHYEPGEAG